MKKTEVVTNFLYNSIYQILIIILPLITTPYISRVLGASGVGIYSYTYSLAYCFALVGMVGVSNYGNRTIAACQDDPEQRSVNFWNIYGLQLIASVVVVLAYLAYVILFPSEEYGIVPFIQILTVAASLIDVNWFFFGIEKFKLTVTRNIVIRVACVVCIFLFVKDADDLWLYVLLMVGSHFLSNLAVWPFLRRYIHFVKPAFQEMKKHIKPMLVLFIPVIAITLYNRMDKVMIGILSNSVQNGYYESAEKIITVPMGLITALGTVMLPRMSNMYARGQSNQASRYLKMSMDFACFMSIALMFGIAAIAIEFAPIFFGSEFTVVGYLIILISPTIFFKSWANVIRTQYLLPLGKDRSYVISVWIGAVINLIVNILLIGQYGATGAIVGTICAEASVMIYQTWSVRKELPIGSYFKSGLPYLIPGIVMFIVVRLIGRRMGASILTIIVEILIGVIVYMALSAPYLYVKYKQIFCNILNRIKRK